MVAYACDEDGFFEDVVDDVAIIFDTVVDDLFFEVGPYYEEAGGFGLFHGFGHLDICFDSVMVDTNWFPFCFA